MRIFSAILMIVSIVYGYWWLTWILAMAFLFYYPLYYEILAWGVIYDALYGLSIPEFNNIRYIFSISSIILFVLAYLLRKYLIAYDDKI
jgi:hypothetical protein